MTSRAHSAVPASTLSRAGAWLAALLLGLLLAGAPPGLGPFGIGPFGIGVAPAFAEDGEVDEADPEMDRDPEGSKEEFDAAEVLREEYKWSEAANGYWQAVEADLANYRAHVRYQQMALKAGDDADEITADYDAFRDEYPNNIGLKLHRHRLRAPEERLPEIAQLLKSHAKVSDVHLEHARVLLALAQPKAALAAMEKAQALKAGDRPDVLVLHAEAEHAAGKTDAAIQRLDARVKADGEDFNARLTLARLQLGSGQHEAALLHASVVIEQRTKYLAAFLVKTEALVALGQDEEALLSAQSAYRVNKDIDDVVIALADVTARQETEAAYKLAIKYYDEVIERDEESYRALYGKAWAFERMEKWEEAEENYREVVAIQPTSSAGVNSVGYCLFKQGRVSDAQVQFKRAIDMDDEFVTALNNLAATHDAQAKYGDAIKLYERVLKMDGQDENLRSLINCAFDYEAMGSFPKAQRMLQKAHAVLPKDTNILVWIGDNFYFQQKYGDAEAWYQKAIALDEKQFFAWRGMGLSLGQRKKWPDAAAAMEKASKLKPDDLDMYVVLGDIYYTQLKELKKALDKYQEFVQRGGNDPDVNDAILDIKKQLEKK